MSNRILKDSVYLLGNDPHQRKIAFTETPNLKAENIFICLPGLLETRDTFAPLFESTRSNQNIRMLSIDYCGRGDSDSLHLGTSYSMSRYISDIEDLVKNYVLQNHMNANARLNLIGTSMGGVLALYLIEKFKNKVSSVALNDIGLKIEWSALSRLNNLIDNLSLEIATSNIHSRVVTEVKSPAHFDLPYQFDLIGMNMANLVKSFEGKILLLHNSSSIMCSSEIAEFSKKKWHSLQVKTIEGQGHPVTWNSEVNDWLLDAISHPQKSLQ